jgi:hypothetical protein
MHSLNFRRPSALWTFGKIGLPGDGDSVRMKLRILPGMLSFMITNRRSR